MSAYCERRLIDGTYCARPERHRGPHENSERRTNADIRRRRLPPCAIRGPHSRAAHLTYCRPAIDAVWRTIRPDLPA